MGLGTAMAADPHPVSQVGDLCEADHWRHAGGAIGMNANAGGELCWPISIVYMFNIFWLYCDCTLALYDFILIPLHVSCRFRLPLLGSIQRVVQPKHFCVSIKQTIRT